MAAIRQILVSKAGPTSYKAKTNEAEYPQTGLGNSIKKAVNDLVRKSGLNPSHFDVAFK